MARIRSCHPEQWSDDAFVTCTPLARLLALGTRNWSDDNGIFEWNPVKLKMRVLPAENCDVAALLSELEDTNQVFPFSVGGRNFGIIRSFQRFQRPKKPTFTYPVPTIPLPPGYELSKAYSPTSGELVENCSGSSHAGGEKEEVERNGNPSNPQRHDVISTTREGAAEALLPDGRGNPRDPRAVQLSAVCAAHQVTGGDVGSAQIAAWVRDRITPEVVLAAITKARSGAKPPPALLRATYLAPIVSQIAAGGAGAADNRWRVDDRAAERLAKELGIPGSRPGEAGPAFRARIDEALAQANRRRTTAALPADSDPEAGIGLPRGSRRVAA